MNEPRYKWRMLARGVEGVRNYATGEIMASIKLVPGGVDYNGRLFVGDKEARAAAEDDLDLMVREGRMEP